jgi:SAM-dependent methyltransferase
MPGRWLYDLIYRFGAPWELGVRPELRELVESGRLRPEAGDRAVDLGCGTGANTVFLAQTGWDTVGVDFSPVATRKAAARARDAGVANIHFVNGDLTAGSIDGAEGPFDLLLDYGTLDDLQGDRRQAMADLMTRIAAPGARCLLWCFFAPRDELPRLSFSGPSRMAPGIEPGEMEQRFGADWDIEELGGMSDTPRTTVFLMTRRDA